MKLHRDGEKQQSNQTKRKRRLIRQMFVVSRNNPNLHFYVMNQQEVEGLRRGGKQGGERNEKKQGWKKI